MVSFNVNVTDPCIEIVCGAGETDVTVNATDIYEFWKDWFLEGDNSKYLQAMDSAGGDDLGGGEALGRAYFILASNGWKICPTTVEPEVTIRIIGNIFPSPASAPLFNYHDVIDGGMCFIEMRTSTLPTIMETGVSGLTPDESTKLNIIADVEILSNQILALNQQMNKLIKLIPAAL